MALNSLAPPTPHARASVYERLRVLVDVQQALMTAPDSRAAAKLVAEQVLALVDASGATVGVLEGGELVFHSASGVLAEHAGLRFRRDEQQAVDGLLSGRVVRANDLQRTSGPLAAWRGSGARSAVALPVGRGREIVGVLLVVSSRTDELTEPEIDLLRIVAGTLALLSGPGDEGEGDRSDAFRCSPVPLVLLDLEGRLVQASDAACELFGYSQQELQAAGLELLLSEGELEEDRETVRQVISCERRSVARLASMRTRRGEELTIVSGARLVRERSGRVVGLLRSFCDVGPELERIERQSRAAASDSVARLAGSTALALNGRIGTVLSALAAIGDLVHPPRSSLDNTRSIHELTAEALAAAREMQTWVHELRRLSAVDERKRRELDVRQALDTAAGLAVEVIRSRARLLRDYQEVPSVEAVEPHLVQLLTQLLLESVESLPPRESELGEIRVATWTEDGKAVVEIWDRSAGAPRGSADGSMLLGDTVRLGLPLLHGLAGAMGGMLDVQSEGGARRMRLELPGAGGRG